MMKLIRVAIGLLSFIVLVGLSSIALSTAGYSLSTMLIIMVILMVGMVQNMKLDTWVNEPPKLDPHTAEAMVEKYKMAEHMCTGWNPSWSHPYEHYAAHRDACLAAILTALIGKKP